VTRRRTKNNRLAGIGYSWAFTAAARPSPAREHYLRRRHGPHRVGGLDAALSQALAPWRKPTATHDPAKVV
jgi:hypothetical protein